MDGAAETFVVLWRTNTAGRWQVQPFVYGPEDADAVGARLMAQFGGEAWLAPINVPARGEDLKEFEEE